MKIIHRVTYSLMPSDPDNHVWWCDGKYHEPDGSVIEWPDVAGCVGITCPGCIAVGGATAPIYTPRPKAHLNQVPVAPIPHPILKADSVWNGVCMLCGKGTYLGAWKLEHEGGPCQSHLGVVSR